MICTRLPTRAGVLTSFVLLLAGCGQTRVRVLNDLTNQPVAGATLTPYVNSFFGTPTEARHVQTDERGYATLPYGGNLHAVDATYPAFREVYPNDKPPGVGQVKLLYLRPVPRIVLMLPPGYTGPVLVTANHATAEQRDLVYRVSAADDPLRPVEVPSIDRRGTRPDEVEVERDGRLVTPGRRDADDGGVHLWVPDASPFPSQDAYVNALYVGRFAAFETLEKALRAHQVGQGGMARLGHDALRHMAVVAEAAGGG